jgi:twitching motility protein PilT
MTSFDQSLALLVKQRLVTYEEALKNSSTPSDFAMLFRGVSGGATAGWTPTNAAEVKPAGGAPSNDEFEIDSFEK